MIKMFVRTSHPQQVCGCVSTVSEWISVDENVRSQDGRSDA